MQPNSRAAAPAPSAYVGRFAPSPTGALHLGSLLAALGSWLIARSVSGRWLIRIEDVDRPREIAGAAAEQLATLKRFGLEPDAVPVYQSERAELYRKALSRLQDADLAFSCRCSRSDLTSTGGIHRACVARPSGHAEAVRLRVPPGPDSRVRFLDRIQGPQLQSVDLDVGDFVLRRADGCWAYQLAVVVDDAAQEITEVVRGADLLGSTPRQILLQRALGLPTPSHAHLPVVVDETGRKLSKSLSSLPVDASDPLPALRWCWRALGQTQQVLDGIGSPHRLLERAVSEFEFKRVPGSLPIGMRQTVDQSPV